MEEKAQWYATFRLRRGGAAFSGVQIEHIRLQSKTPALLLDLQKECGISMLLLTHDIGGAWTVSDRIAVLPRQ